MMSEETKQEEPQPELNKWQRLIAKVRESLEKDDEHKVPNEILVEAWVDAERPRTETRSMAKALAHEGRFSLKAVSFDDGDNSAIFTRVE